MMIRFINIFSISILCFGVSVTPAMAHLPSGEYVSFASGVSHPLFGLDHILAMMAVGLWASTMGSRAQWVVPFAFVSLMVIGFGLALTQMSLPFVEPMILASIIVFGLVVAMAIKWNLWLCSALAGLFAIFHGHAHGVELGNAEAIQFGLGFAVATMLLHGVGFSVGVLAVRVVKFRSKSSSIVARSLGAVTAFTGVILAIG